LPSAYGTHVDQDQAKESLGREQADLEVVQSGNYDKEVYFLDCTEKEVPKGSHNEAPRREEEKTVHRLRKRTFWVIVLIACLLVLGIALGVGLGVGLKKHK
jgi:hypothetical protein